MIHKTAPVTVDSPCCFCGHESSAVLKGGMPVCREHFDDTSRGKGFSRRRKKTFEEVVGDAGEAMFDKK